MGVVSLGSVGHQVASLDFSPPGCGSHVRTTVGMDCAFTHTAGRTNATHGAGRVTVTLDWLCHAAAVLHVRAGHLTLSRFCAGPRRAPGSTAQRPSHPAVMFEGLKPPGSRSGPGSASDGASPAWWRVFVTQTGRS